MKHALNATDIKYVNQRLILDAIFQSDTTSRTQLSRELHLSKPAVSDNLKPLLDLGIVDERGVGSPGPSGGRKSVLLRFNPAHRLIIAVSLNFSDPVFALLDLNGTILNSFDITISPEAPIESCCDLLLGGIRMLLQSLGERQDTVYCIAVAAPGVFNANGELIHYSTSCNGPPWWQLNLKQAIADVFSFPVIVYNDVKAATLGEWICGAGKQEENLFYLHAGLGIGSGIILSGKPLMGENFSAGEISCNFDPLNGCNGRRLEEVVCIEYLEKECLQRADSAFTEYKQIQFEDIIQAYKIGNPMVCRLIDDICYRLAVLSYNYMSFISINHIVFGGDYVPFGDCFARHLKALFQKSLWPFPDLRMSSLGKYAGIHGLVFLAREQYFKKICSQS